MSTVPGQPPVDPADLRIGDTDRNSALQALGDHMAAGRIDMAEFDSRSARVTAARTARDLQGLFDDLPEPHPRILGLTPGWSGAGAGASALVPSAPAAVPAVPPRSKGQALLAAATASSGLLAVVLFFVLMGVGVSNAWLAFLLVPLVAGVARAVQGQQDGR
ncbi:DUF1707 SHOCT-like domain-containing protein [Nakamurella endophytica]|nr:DUF1707 domain-containing protein [Nakamurella endophytica]